MTKAGRSIGLGVHDVREALKNLPVEQLAGVANTAIIASSITTAIGLVAIPFFLAVMCRGWPGSARPGSPRDLLTGPDRR